MASILTRHADQKKRKVVLLASIGLCLVAGAIIALIVLGRKAPFPEERPITKPVRADRSLLKKFSDADSISSILGELTTSQEEISEPAELSPEAAFAAALPFTPPPIEPTEAFEKPAQSLIDYWEAKPSSHEWSENDQQLALLATDALGKENDILPRRLQAETDFSPESDTFPLSFRAADTGLTAPDGPGAAIRLAKDDNKMSLLTAGGSTLWTWSEQEKTFNATDLSVVAPAGREIVPADFDLDGDDDWLILREAGEPFSLVRNDGDGVFIDVTQEAGLLCFGDLQDAIWADFDADNRLDIALGYADQPLQIFCQTQPGKFQEQAWELGVWVAGSASSLTLGDFDQDKLPDLFVGRHTGGSKMFLNQAGRNAELPFMESPARSLGIGAISSFTHLLSLDLNGDAEQDLIAWSRPAPQETIETETDAAEELEPPASSGDAGEQLAIYIWDAEKFVDATEQMMPRVPSHILSIDAADLDWDSLPELLIATDAGHENQILWNRGSLGFIPIQKTARANFFQATESLVCADLTGDGVDDFYAYTPAGRGYLAVGAGEHSNQRVIIPLPEKPIPGGSSLTVVARDADWVLREFSQFLPLPKSGSTGLGLAESAEVISFTLTHPVGEKRETAEGQPLPLASPIEWTVPLETE